MRTLLPHLESKTHIIWDWNGTLLNDVALCVEITAEISHRHGLKPLGLDDYLRVFRLPIVEFYRNAGFDFERVPFTELSKQFIEPFMARAPHTPLFDGARDLLE